MNPFIKINPADDVAVALVPISKGTTVLIGNQRITLNDDVPTGHKFLLTDKKKGDDVIKYGYSIGKLREDHHIGDCIDHRHIQTNLSGLLDYSYCPVNTELPSATTLRHFSGYRRSNGDVGIRNELWIIPTVGCVNGICLELKEALQSRLGKRFPVHAFTHNYGCSQLGDDHDNTRKILRDMALHPNAGGVLIVGLGCENNQPESFEATLGDYDKRRIRFFVAQKVEDEITTGMSLLMEIVEEMRHDVRVDIPLGELRVGLKCGGSDGLSGITANPLLGMFSDFIVAQGGTTVLTEVPEMFGAETILMNRCANEELFHQTVELINGFKQYYISHGEPVGENPSPGNKAGGISTLEEKALGCTQKSGMSAVRGVLAYGERLSEKGLNLLSAPGNDLVASTALAAAGCHLVLFTTGRGTPFGTFVPTLKVSTNNDLAKRKSTWIDFNAGTLAEGEDKDTTLERFVEKVIEIANGEMTWNEKKHYQEIAIFKTGVTL